MSTQSSTLPSLSQRTNNQQALNQSDPPQQDDVPPSVSDDANTAAVARAAVSAPGKAAINSFDDLNLNEALLRGIYAYGFETPSTIQREAIPKLLTGKDTIAQAQSGTGKTATFSISILELIDPSKSVTQAIVLEPTRELAEQTADVLAAFSGPHIGGVFKNH